MVLGLNWIDLVVIGVLILFALEAVGRPLVLESLDFISFLLSFFFSFRAYNFPAKFFETQFHIPHGLSLVFGFMLVWFLSEAIFFLLVRIFLPKIPKINIPGINTLSIIPALLRGLIFIAIALVLVSTFPIQPNIKKSVLDSKLGSQILKVSYNLEAPVKQVFGGAANDSLTFLTIKPKTDERVNLGFHTDQFSIDEQSENLMIDLVNRERVSRGLKALSLDGRLREVGRGHSADMLKRGYFSHYSPEGLTVADRVTNAGIDFLIVGENLAYAPNVELAHQGLMNSEGHRANILSADFSKIGIGVMDGGVYGRMFTQVFSN
ncbi:MAG: CvpA family protein [Patescibacteria group bacterium]|nr:CvpA family protein [Patescibacteria group bacterium]